MSKFQVGDEVWSFIYGDGVVSKIDSSLKYPIEVKFDSTPSIISFTSDGKDYFDHAAPTLYHKGVDIIEHLPDRHQFEKWEPILVRSREEDLWILDAFMEFKKEGDAIICIGRTSIWRNYIPYKGNEHLLGTKDSPK